MSNLSWYPDGLQFPMTDSQFKRYMKALNPERTVDSRYIHKAKNRGQSLYEMVCGNATVEFTHSRGDAVKLMEKQGKYISVDIYEVMAGKKKLVARKFNGKVLFNNI